MKKELSKYSQIIFENKLFENIGEDCLDAALRFYDATVTEYKKGDYLHMAGNRMTRFGLVLSGCVQALTDDIDGNHMIMANVTEGNSFGEALCFLGAPEPSVYIMASMDSVILWMSAGNLRGISADSMALTLKNNFMALMSVRTLQMNRRIQILSKLTIREKIMTFLSEIADMSQLTQGHKEMQTKQDAKAGRDSQAEQDARLSAQNKRTVVVPMNREDMAAYIGTNRSALSRELSAMKAEGILDYHKNIFTFL